MEEVGMRKSNKTANVLTFNCRHCTHATFWNAGRSCCVCLFLSSKQASFITGATLCVDGAKQYHLNNLGIFTAMGENSSSPSLLVWDFLEAETMHVFK